MDSKGGENTLNPENEEFWLPSDVYHEINNPSTFLFHAPLSPSISYLPFPFHHPNVTGCLVGYGFYLSCAWIAAFQFIYNPFPFYVPFIPPYQVLKRIQRSVCPIKSKGTGVFIPNILMNSTNKKFKLQARSENIIVPLKHQLTINNGKGECNKYKSLKKKKGKKKAQESRLSLELNLPQEWAY